MLNIFCGKSLIEILMWNGCRIEVESPVKIFVRGLVPDLERIAGTNVDMQTELTAPNLPAC